MLFKGKKVLIWCVGLLITACEQKYVKQIEPIQSFSSIDFSSIKPESLVIFDVDETLIQPEDTFLINEHTPQGKDFIQKLIQTYPIMKSDNHIASIMLQEAQRPLLEPSVIHHINKLKNRGVFVIACTAMNTGPYGIHSSLEEWRYNHLKFLGFEGTFSNTLFPISYLERKPIFYKGLLATDLQSKGPIVGKFIDVMKLKLKDIIMIDDDNDCLLSVKNECEKRGINFKGYEYKGSKTVPWDEDLVQFQSDYLIKHKKWLSDKVAKALMVNKVYKPLGA
ncbi:hypothetical protein IM40_02460 [Candidatus Paracaedimonas acanthamoebae]|nr:hypothetical protein IM40_02460 [Candidatus Paracaedimonas acanthamoebae]